MFHAHEAWGLLYFVATQLRNSASHRGFCSDFVPIFTALCCGSGETNGPTQWTANRSSISTVEVMVTRPLIGRSRER